MQPVTVVRHEIKFAAKRFHVFENVGRQQQHVDLQDVQGHRQGNGRLEKCAAG